MKKNKKIQDIKQNKNSSFSYIKENKPKQAKLIADLIKFAIFAFLIIIIINIINVYSIGQTLKKDISTSTFDGYNYLMDAGKSTTRIQFSQAKIAFENAQINFSQAKDLLWFYETDETIYSKNSDISLAVNNILDGGKDFARAGEYFLEALEYFNQLPIYFVNNNSQDILSEPTKQSITDILNLGLEKTNLAIDKIKISSEKINKIDESIIPTEARYKLKIAKEKIQEISDILVETQQHFPALLKLLGDKHPHRYLVLFQNNNEMRPTGGFIGSYAIIDLNDGLIQKLETHDVYDIDGSFGERITPPGDFSIFSNVWRLRDSNYWPDFPLSAQKAMWFLEKEGGPSVDTVIAINQGLIKDLLDITGPIQVGDFGEFTSANYNLLLSFIIESKAWGAEDPKLILKLFVPAFKTAILKEENISQVSSKLYKAIQQKHIVMYSKDEDIQSLFDSIGTSGRMYTIKPGEDYLNIVNVSTGGTKSDKFIEEKIVHNTDINLQGEIINEVQIFRHHQWTDDIYYDWKKILYSYGITKMPDQTIDILGRGRNRTSIRVYVPPDSILLDASTNDITTNFDADLNKTFFLSTMEITAGQSDNLWIKYKLPFKLDPKESISTYKLIAEKQLGNPGAIFTKTFKSDPKNKILATYPANLRADGSGRIIYPTDLVYDKYFSAIIKK